MAGFAFYHHVVPREWEQDAVIIDIIHGSQNLKPGKYIFAEMYCTDEDCDCRRAMIRVLDQEGCIQATLSYAWENYDFYKGWFGGDDISIQGICGVTLYDLQPQGPAAEQLRQMFENTFDHDPGRVERIKNHYFKFKQIINHQHEEEKKRPESVKVGRNEKCPCGSGKKYKKCCALKRTLALVE